MIYFEDLEVGVEAYYGRYEVTREEVLEFAGKYDPQPFHLDDDAAAATHFGSVAASGWHTGAMAMAVIARKVVAAFQNKPAHSGSGDADDLDTLSHREKEILEQLSKGLMYKEIAAELFISPETVRKHVYHIYEKLHVSNRVEAVNKFFGR